jgi:lysophospholipase L1-like esterase
MNRNRFVLVAFWLLLPTNALMASCGPEAQEIMTPDVVEPHSYLALGDSYTIGTGVARSDTFPAQLTKAFVDQNLAVPTIIAQNGWTTGDLIAGIEAASLEGPYDLVTLLIGVNNQFQGRPLDEYSSEFSVILEAAIDLANANPEKVIVLSIPDWGATSFASRLDRDQITSQIESFNHEAREIAEEAGVHYVEITSISRLALEDPSLLSADGLHPSSEMYALWVQELVPVAIQVLNER